MELTYNNQIYTIKLETDTYNHYYVGNTIDAHFFKYYLANVVNLIIDTDDDSFDYTVQIIDQEVNIINLTSDHSIVLEANSYKIMNNNDDQNPIENDDEQKTNDLTNDLNEYVTLDHTNI